MSRAHEPNDILRAKVKCWAEWLPERIISKRIGVSIPTLRKYYREELLDAPMERNMEVVKALYNNAVNRENVTAQIFWIKYRMGINDNGTQGSESDESMVAQPLEISFEVNQPVADIIITKGEKKEA